VEGRRAVGQNQVEAVPDLGEELVGGDADDCGHQHHLEGAHRQTLRGGDAIKRAPNTSASRVKMSLYDHASAMFLADDFGHGHMHDSESPSGACNRKRNAAVPKQVLR